MCVCERLRVTESQFADDVALYANSQDVIESVAWKFMFGANEWGVTTSTEKTKGWLWVRGRVMRLLLLSRWKGRI